jgi:hypothetical protein
MNWRTFWKIFCTAQFVGVSLAMLGILHNFFAVILGRILLFPGILIVSGQVNLEPAALIVAMMLAINVAFWMAILRPQSK